MRREAGPTQWLIAQRAVGGTQMGICIFCMDSTAQIVTAINVYVHIGVSRQGPTSMMVSGCVRKRKGLPEFSCCVNFFLSFFVPPHICARRETVGV